MADRLVGCSVLVVDDEESIRQLVRDGLGVRGVHVEEAASGEEALERLQARTYDAVLCDLNLSRGVTGRISGHEVWQRVSNGLPSDGRPFFLFMTGELVDRATLDGLSTAGTRTMQKPFRISELIALLAEAVTSESAGSRRKQAV
jgi:CheY-like chemotaxis protein